MKKKSVYKSVYLEEKEIAIEHLEEGIDAAKGKRRMGPLKRNLQVLKDGAHCANNRINPLTKSEKACITCYDVRG